MKIKILKKFTIIIKVNLTAIFNKNRTAKNLNKNCIFKQDLGLITE